MQTSTLAILILSVLDAAILILVPLMDKRLYKDYPKEQIPTPFLINTRYDGPVYRFVYSSGGAVLVSVVFLAVIIISRQYEQAAG